MSNPWDQFPNEDERRDGHPSQDDQQHPQGEPFASHDMPADHDPGDYADEQPSQREATQRSGGKGRYLIMAVIGAVTIGAVWMVGSRLYALVAPPDSGMGAPQQAMPFDPPKATSDAMPGGLQTPAQAAPVVAAAPVQAGKPADEPAAPGLAKTDPPSSGTPAPVPANPVAAGPVTAPPVAAAPVVAAPAVPASIQPAAATCGSASACEKIADLQRQIDEMRLKMDSGKEAPKKAVKPATPRAGVASGDAARSKQASGATRPKSAAPVRTAAARPVKPESSGNKKASDRMLVDENETVMESRAAPPTLGDYSIFAIYPNSGEHQIAYLNIRGGRTVAVREGDMVMGARVTRIDGQGWRVDTTAGAIR